MKNSIEVMTAPMEPMGVRFTEQGLQVVAAFETDTEQRETNRIEYGMVLYDDVHKRGIRIPFPAENRVGKVYAMLLKGYQNRNCSYLFYRNNDLLQDTYARATIGKKEYGKSTDTLARCAVLPEGYDWQGDRQPKIPYEDCVFYGIHVRGYTRHKSSGVKKKGTFAGLTEKIAYFKELGVTSLLLMPAYEFEEVMPAVKNMPEKTRINYWGYQKGLYFTPKSAYAYGTDSVTEMKNMVRELHGQGIEVLMQFYFPPEILKTDILAVLKFWLTEYHIDGFQLMGVDMPLSMVTAEPLLAETKILTDQQFVPATDRNGQLPMSVRQVAWMDDSFLFDMRRFLKGDDNMIHNFLYHIRNNRPENGIINYMAKWDGLRLADMVSYDRKHNEKNGEDNQDGTDYNCSWNCGIEGKSKKKAITTLRMQQMKNALVLLLLSQGTPFLYGGDEFGNSQEGNNNPYCQDNEIAWVKWSDTEKSIELMQFTKELLALRKAHPILHSETPLKGIDTRSCGYPDISYHGKEAWRPDTSPVSRCMGILYACCYGKTEEDDNYLYMGVNMHWEPHTLGLPQLPKGKKWVRLLGTCREKEEEELHYIAESERKQELTVPARTILLYITEDCPVEKTTFKNRKKKKEEKDKETDSNE